MALTLTHKTTDEQISRWTKDDLQTALIEGPDDAVRVARLKKGDLVVRTLLRRDRLAEEEAAREADAKAAHDAQLEAEWNDPAVSGRKQSLVAAFAGLADKAKGRVVEIVAEISADPLAASNRIAWKGGDLMYETAVYGRLATLAGYGWDGWTQDEIATNLAELEESKTSECIERDGFRFGSSSVLHNVEEMQQHKALQYSVKVLRSVRRGWARAVENNDSEVRVSVW